MNENGIEERHKSSIFSISTLFIVFLGFFTIAITSLKFAENLNAENQSQIVSAITYLDLKDGIDNKITRDLNNKEQNNKSIDLIDCSVIEGHPSQFNLIPLLSLPGAGNTWTRFLLEQATGYLTGSVYFDRSLKSYLKGEFINFGKNSTVVVKTHNIKLLDKRRYNITGCIFIFRDLADSILADYTRQQNRNDHTASISEEDLKKKDWNEWVRHHKRVFTHMYISGLDYCHNNTNIIFYEDLKKSSESLINTIRKTVEFINENSPENTKPIIFREKCLRLHTEGKFHRSHDKKDKLDPRKYIDVSERWKINERIKIVNQSMVDALGEDAALPGKYLV